jgi:histidinol-phosphate/aromatic aminotransferase/cobyric acid decarboxylase-like protein
MVDKNPNILVIRTFFQDSWNAGLRIGFIIGNAATIKTIEPNYFQSTNFCLSTLSMSAALASLK